MAGYRGRWARGTAWAAVLAAALTGCSGGNGNTPTSPASKAASALASAGARATAAISSLAAQATEAISSATAEAGRRLGEVKNGVEAKDDVQLGTPATAADGRTTVGITVKNTADSTKSFAVQVVFKDSGGKLIDTVVVTVSDVAAGKTGTATARSTHNLSGEVKTEVGSALRY
ncbi:FxLYD domain-containing protein [Streptomyces sp. NPDC002265]|uniref:FxLYD domain-containing protein n=1 Tax=Streptomyces sp. NPDC002265 TaxID=3154415 RepID=UPI00332B3D87